MESSAGKYFSRVSKHAVRQRAIDVILLALLTLFFRATLAMAGGGDAGICAQTGVTDAYQPQIGELASALEAAANRSLGPDYADPGLIYSGIGANQALVPATFPCVILKAIAYVESGWRQAYSVPRGSSGLPLVSGGCGYGVMQITSPMISPGEIDPGIQRRIAREYRYNVSYGAKMLAGKWNITPTIGGNNPVILEDWYYAVWAYNGFSSKNNPRYYNPSRPPFNGSQPWQNYPYQELVYGYAANPPAIDGAPRWNAEPATLPQDSWIDPTTPGPIQDPSPTHVGTCSGPPPPPTPTPTPSPTPTPTPTPLPNLSASTNALVFLAEPNTPASPQIVTLRGDRGPALNWQAQPPSASWISASPTSGSVVPANLTVSTSTAGFTGYRSGSLTVQNLSKPGQFIVISINQYVGTLWKLRFPTIYR